MGHTLRSTILVTAAACLLACHPRGIDDAAETDTVVTRRAKDYDYSRNLTYDIPDKIADLCDVDTSQLPGGDGGAAGARPSPFPEGAECNEITHAFDAAITGKRFQATLPYAFADGSEHWVDFAMSPVFDENATVIFVVVTGTDVSPREIGRASCRERV